MLPLGDGRSPRSRFPLITYLFLVINVLVFFLEIRGGDPFIMRWSFIPKRFSADPSGNAVTILTAMFMHGGWMHLISNMLYLLIFGDNVEDRFGHFKFIVFYLLSGIAATFAQFFVNPGSAIPTLGASGAIAGVLGAYLLMFPSRNIRVLMGMWVMHVRAIFVIGLWFILQLVSGYALLDMAGDTGGVAYMAHVGGFIAGFLLTFIFR